MQISDPREIPQDSLPLFVFSDSSTDLVAFLITWRTKGSWNHAMLCVNNEKFAVQGLTYKEESMDVYIKKGCRLDFYCLINSTPDIAIAAKSYVSNRLSNPWWTKMYDWVGIFGQAIGFPKIHTPGLEYCSVDVTNCLKNICYLLPQEDQKIINGIPAEVNPQQLHDLMVNNTKVFKEYGYYESDEGVVL